ncbi:hypothetical protein ABB02_00085 [Clostridiaceae bacterium JG1575]|nr:hypothetical protein ABB02_00085 [Clostridiaceae bacterium JG1575]
MNILLIRHGEALARNLALADEERPLTLEGRKAVQRFAPILAFYLKQHSVRLITSPKLRARQTAKLLEEAGLPAPEVMRFVATGTLSSLKRLLRGTLDTTLVIVGHAPYLDEWIYALTEQCVTLSKGGVAQIELTEGDVLKGRVTFALSLADASRLLAAGGIRDWKTLFEKDLSRVLEGAFDAMMSRRDDFLAAPSASEGVHQLRVKIRQYRSVISLLKPLLKKKTYRSLQGKLRGFAQECAYLRELDVLLEQWRDASALFEAHHLTGEAFEAILRAERAQEAQRLFQFFETPKRAQQLEEIQRELRSSLSLKKAPCYSLDDLVCGTLKTWHQKIQEQVQRIDANDRAAIHALRIRSKKIRYVLEVFKREKTPRMDGMYAQEKAWQEHLGRITDANRNQEAVLEIAAHYPHAPIEEELAVFLEQQKAEAQGLYEAFFKEASLAQA